MLTSFNSNVIQLKAIPSGWNEDGVIDNELYAIPMSNYMASSARQSWRAGVSCAMLQNGGSKTCPRENVMPSKYFAPLVRSKRNWPSKSQLCKLTTSYTLDS
ncbi:hypothetical protein H257_18880 [Aphanomyces astaci]|uniref:Uncharacterized protein n=1 Tax=Aphanomyces astaci TaxID=112090 RepID=W4F9N1_APHAT|nr:hypothetical protein H257_18880 [Aphanomyces astaci]ETV64200.1 hypothetical protein H257_18880 [Aphanomyces astaci]|eukprot:XP_009846313.1 hypothetical protein H257_18880 [Aphanomyces astaci]